jgi:hypothetical protein
VNILTFLNYQPQHECGLVFDKEVRKHNVNKFVHNFTNMANLMNSIFNLKSTSVSNMFP